MRKPKENCPLVPDARSSLARIYWWALIAASGLAAILDLVVAWQLSGSMDVVNYHLLAIFAVIYLVDQQRPVPSPASTLNLTSLLLA